MNESLLLIPIVIGAAVITMAVFLVLRNVLERRRQTIERRLKAVRPGQTVRIGGWLVEARGSDAAAHPGPAMVQPRASITRRPALEMASPREAVAPPKAVAVGQSAEMPLSPDTPALPGEFDLNLDLEVPAFLRRNEG